MDFNDLNKKIDEIDALVKAYYNDETLTQKELIYGKALKLNEEVWELTWEVLSYFWSQRKEKLEESNLDSLKWEFADVLITTMLLAKNMNIDIEESFNEKIQKIYKRLSK